MSCCNSCDPTRAVIANSAVTAPTTDPVTMTLDQPLPTGCRFVLCIPNILLANTSTALVELTDGTTTYTLFTDNVDEIRYDQLVAKARRSCCSSGSIDVCGVTRLRCCLRADFRVLVETLLPETSYLPPATAASTA